MLQFIKKILRLRKQNDAVKLVFLFSILAITSLSLAIVHIVQYAKIVAGHVEYIAVDTEGSVTDGKIRTLSEIDTVLCISRNYEQTIIFRNGEKEIRMICYALDDAYIKQAYKIECISSMQIFYANDMAFSQIRQSLITYGYENPTDEMQVSYMDAVGGHEQDAYGDYSGMQTMQYKTAKIVRADVGDNKEPYLFCAGDPIDLKKNAGEVRILLDNQSESHNVIAHLNTLSMSVENTESIKQIQTDMEIKLLKVQYECIIVCLCILAAFVIGRLVSKAQ